MLDATVEQFWTSSYSSTSTDDLCARTGLSRSSLYNTFGNKRTVYLTALDRYIQQRVADRAATLARPETGRELLEIVLRKVLDVQYAEPGRRVCFAIHGVVEVGTSDEQIGTTLADNAAAFDATLEEIISRGTVDGSIGGDISPAALARVVHATLDGLQIRARITPSRNDIDNDIATVMRLIP